jgi:hypothetical protein
VAPIRRFRTVWNRANAEMESTWNYWSRNADLLAESIESPVENNVITIRTSLDNYRLYWANIVVWRETISQLLRPLVRGVAVTCAVLVSFAVFTIVDQFAVVWIAALLSIIVAISAWPLSRVAHWLAVGVGRNWILMSGTIAWICTIGAGIHLIRADGSYPGIGWAAIAGSLAISVAIISFLMISNEQVPLVLSGWRLRRLRKEYARSAMLDRLLDLVEEISVPANRIDFQMRGHWIFYLEDIALTMEKSLAPTVAATDPATREWVQHRQAGAVAAVRRMKREIISSRPGSWPRLLNILRQQIDAVATGDLARLRWVTPPALEQRRRSRIAQAMGALRVVVVACVPVIVIIAAEPFLALSPAIDSWIKIAGLIWAIISILIAVDPAVRDKLETAQVLSQLFRDSRPAGDPARSERPTDS